MAKTTQPKIGDKAACKMCDQEIEYVGPYWQEQQQLTKGHGEGDG